MLRVETYIVEFIDQLQFRNLNDFDNVCSELDRIIAGLAHNTYSQAAALDLNPATKQALCNIANLTESVFPTPDELASTASAADKIEYDNYLATHTTCCTEFKGQLQIFLEIYIARLQQYTSSDKLEIITKQQQEQPRLQFNKVLDQLLYEKNAKSRFAAAALIAKSRPSTQLNARVKQQLTALSVDPVLFGLTTDPMETDLCLAALKILDAIRSETILEIRIKFAHYIATNISEELDLNVAELQDREIIDHCEAIIKLFAGGYFKIADFKDFDPQLQLYLFKNANRIIKLMTRYGLATQEISPIPVDILNLLIFNDESLANILIDSGVTIQDLLQLSSQGLRRLFDSAAEFIPQCYACGITLRELFDNMPKLEILLLDPKNISILRTITTYFFVKKETLWILNKAQFLQLLQEPAQLSASLVKNNKSVSPAAVQEALNNFNTIINNSCNNLIKTQYLLHIINMRSAARTLQTDLLAAGLNFQQTREIYEIFAVQLLGFINSFSTKCMYQTAAKAQPDIDNRTIKYLLTPELQALVFAQAQICRTTFTMCLNDKLPPQIEKFTKLQSLIAVANELKDCDAKISMALSTLEKHIQIASNANAADFKISHLMLLGSIIAAAPGANLNIATTNAEFAQLTGDLATILKDNDNAETCLSLEKYGKIFIEPTAAVTAYMQFLNSMFNLYKKLEPQCLNMYEYMPRTGVADESPLFRAITTQDLTKLKQLLQQKVKVFDYNNRGVTVLACATATGNREIIALVRQAIRTQGTLDYQDLCNRSNRQRTPTVLANDLCMAIRENNVVLAESLIAHGCDCSHTSSDGTAPMELAIELGRSIMAEEMLTQLKYKSPPRDISISKTLRNVFMSSPCP